VLDTDTTACHPDSPDGCRAHLASAVTGVLPTVTYPSHTTLVTGVAPATHGILNNSPFDPLHRNQDGWMWYAEDIKAETLWAAARKAGFVSSSVDWPVTVGAPIAFNIVQYWRATTEDDHKLLRRCPPACSRRARGRSAATLLDTSTRLKRIHDGPNLRRG
jgi:hypothetical protein